MKRIAIFLTLFLVLSSCAKEMELASSRGRIVLRPSVGGSSRAVVTDITNLEAFRLTARTAGEVQANYIDDVEVSLGPAGDVVDFGDYYWLEDTSLDFYAWGPSNNSGRSLDGQIVPSKDSSWCRFAVAPSPDATEQRDMLFAYTRTDEASSKGGVKLTFQHAESQIRLAVKNTNESLCFEIDGWGLVNIADSATFSFSGSFDENGRVKATDWVMGEESDEIVFFDSPGEFSVNGALSGPQPLMNGDLPSNMVLIPQKASPADRYEPNEDGDPIINKAALVIYMRIMNNDSGLSEIVGWTECCWPVEVDWEPGRCYTYVVDLAEGGFWPYDRNGDGVLDPVLDRQVTVVSALVDEWDAPEVEAIGYRDIAKIEAHEEWGKDTLGWSWKTGETDLYLEIEPMYMLDQLSPESFEVTLSYSCDFADTTVVLPVPSYNKYLLKSKGPGAHLVVDAEPAWEAANWYMRGVPFDDATLRVAIKGTSLQVEVPFSISGDPHFNIARYISDMRDIEDEEDFISMVELDFPGGEVSFMEEGTWFLCKYALDDAVHYTFEPDLCHTPEFEYFYDDERYIRGELTSQWRKSFVLNTIPHAADIDVRLQILKDFIEIAEDEDVVEIITEDDVCVVIVDSGDPQEYLPYWERDYSSFDSIPAGIMQVAQSEMLSGRVFKITTYHWLSEEAYHNVPVPSLYLYCGLDRFEVSSYCHWAHPD